jgi:hypothetical protein
MSDPKLEEIRARPGLTKAHLVSWADPGRQYLKPAEVAWLIKQAEELAAVKARVIAEIEALQAKIARFEHGSTYLLDPRDDWRAQITLLERVGGERV